MTRHVFKNPDSVNLLIKIADDLESLALKNRSHFSLEELTEMKIALIHLESVRKSMLIRPDHIEEYC